jgi:hypothetical protein
MALKEAEDAHGRPIAQVVDVAPMGLLPYREEDDQRKNGLEMGFGSSWATSLL